MWFTAPPTSPDWSAATTFLSNADPLMKAIIARVGPCGLKPRRDYFVVLAQSIFTQQISTKVATVLFNRFGRRLDAFGGLALPDVYEEGRTQLDLTVEQRLPRGFEMKLSATRLLGQEVRYTQSFPNGDTVTTRQYDLGRAVSLSLSWEPGR